MWPIAVICVLTLCIDLVVHISALLGFNPQDWVKPIWLTWMIFVGMLVGTIALMNVAERLWKRRMARQGEAVEEYVPPFGLKIVRKVVLAYSILVLLYFGYPCLHRGEPVEQGAGHYVLDPGH